MSTGEDRPPGSPPGDTATEKISRRRNMEKICAWCRKVQLPDGTWRPGRRASDATVPTHGICPECAKRADIGGS